MTTRAPIHVGSGEPVLLLHPFLISQLVWETVAQQLADTGDYEVFAPTMAGHNGGPRAGTWFLSSSVLADHVEQQLDELGWNTAHIVGNSLGGLLTGLAGCQHVGNQPSLGGCNSFRISAEGWTSPPVDSAFSHCVRGVSHTSQRLRA